MGALAKTRRPVDFWRRSPANLLVGLAAITVGSAAALGWMGWETLRRDEVVEAQRQRDRLDLDADRVVQAFERQLSDVDARLVSAIDAPAEAGPDLPGFGAGVIFTRTTIQSVPPRALLFHPVTPERREPPAGVFEAAEAIEFRKKDPLGAAEMFRGLAKSPDPLVRAAALMRFARALRSAGEAKAALSTYAEMAALGDVPVIGLPADLLARGEHMRLLDHLGQKEEARSMAEALVKDLSAGRWVLTRAQYDLYIEEAMRVAGVAATPTRPAALSHVAAALWTGWQAEPQSRGRGLRRSGDVSFLAVWRSTPERFLAWLVEPTELVATLALAPGISVAVSSDAEGFIATGEVNRARTAIRAAAETGLPWTLHITRTGGDDGVGVTRGPLVIGGLALMLVVLVAGSYFIGRAIKREADLARLQTDFVSAVSHEFRTPLAAMRQLSELLAAGRVPQEAKRQHYYESLAGESRRLQRLVENLLNFGKLESGAAPYRFEPLDPRALVEEVVAEYRSQLAHADCPIEVVGEGNTPALLADRDAVALALHNLLDNAVKYSGGNRPVHMTWSREGTRVALSVRDEGPGIAAEDQKRIFQKFVRGAAAASANVRGTGVGLAMVDLIAKGHGGEVVVTSQPGAGATFTMLLPATGPVGTE